jgi:uncharacterized protein YegL
MTDKNLCEVIVVLDRSGSMTTIRADMEGGFKSFLEEQRALPGRCVVSLYQFDDQYEKVFEERDVRELQGISITPRGNTALLDAVGRTIVSAGERLAKKPEHERPGAVIVLVITDGQENASREYGRPEVKQLVEQQQKSYAWKFVYLGADLSAFAEAASMGFAQNAVATYDSMDAGSAYAGASNQVRSLRTATAKGEGAEWSASLGGELDEHGNVKGATP